MPTRSSVALVLLSVASCSAVRHLTPLRTPRTSSGHANGPAAGPAPLPARSPGLPWIHTLLPAVSYAGLASITAGALHVVQPVFAWQGVALVGGCVGLPAALLLGQLLLYGGAGIAKSMGGVPADAALTALAREAAAAVGVPAPSHVFQIERREPNAFAASSIGSRDSTVAVTSGLRSVLSTRELQAVLAHEMGHLRFRDVARNMHVAVAAAGLGGVYQAGRILLDTRSRSSSRKKKDDDASGAGLGLLLMAGGMAAQGVAHLAQLAASRGSELRADRAAAEAYGADTLISALRKIDVAAARAPADLRGGGGTAGFMAHAMFSDGPTDAALAAGQRRGASSGGVIGWVARLTRVLRTHPPTEERVLALEKAAAAGLVSRSGLVPRAGFFS